MRDLVLPPFLLKIWLQKVFDLTLLHSPMALFLRRAVSSRSFFSVRDSVYRSRSISYLSSSSFFKASSQTSVSGADASSSHVGSEFLKETRRGFAKGKKSKEDGGGGSTLEAMPDVGPIAKATAKSLMEAAIDALSRELSKLRTGRASAGMLDHIIVDTGGVKMPLSRLAVISVIDSKTLSVTPYDPNSIKEVESAIVSSPLGLNPQLDGQRLIAPIPPLTKEHMQAICKVVTKSAEDVKQSIRRARQKALDTIKKAASGISKDDVKRLEKEIDEITKKFIKSAEDMCKAKEKEISSG